MGTSRNKVLRAQARRAAPPPLTDEDRRELREERREKRERAAELVAEWNREPTTRGRTRRLERRLRRVRGRLARAEGRAPTPRARRVSVDPALRGSHGPLFYRVFGGLPYKATEIVVARNKLGGAMRKRVYHAPITATELELFRPWVDAERGEP